MKTLKAFTEQSHINPALIRAVVRQLGGWDSFKECAPDIANHGINGGFHGFIYYCDTVRFARKHKALIIELAKAEYSYLGYGSIYIMMSEFSCFKDDKDLTSHRLAEIINGRFNDQDCDYTTVFNGMAWYAAEEVARSYSDLIEGN